MSPLLAVADGHDDGDDAADGDPVVDVAHDDGVVAVAPADVAVAAVDDGDGDELPMVTWMLHGYYVASATRRRRRPTKLLRSSKTCYSYHRYHFLFHFRCRCRYYSP